MREVTSVERTIARHTRSPPVGLLRYHTFERPNRLRWVPLRSSCVRLIIYIIPMQLSGVSCVDTIGDRHVAGVHDLSMPTFANNSIIRLDDTKAHVRNGVAV